MKAFERIFRKHLGSKSAQEALVEAVEITFGERACLLCFERDHSHCHRSIVAVEMAEKRKLQIQHLSVQQGLAEKVYCGDLEKECV